MDKSMSKLEDTVKTRGAWHAAVHGVAKSRTRLSGSRTKQPPDTLSFFLKDFFPFLCHPPSCFPSCFYSNSFLKDGLSLGPRFILFCSHTTSLGNPIHSSVQPRSFSWLVCPPAWWTFLWVYFMWDYYTMFMECFLCARNCPMSGKDLGTSHCPCLKENSHVSPFFPQSNPSVKVSPLLFSCSGSKSDPQKIWTSRTHEYNIILKKSLCS